MALPGLISLEELQARPGFDGVDEDQAQAVIDDASALVREVAKPDLDTIDYMSPDRPPSIVPVVVAMCRRALVNPRGLTGEQLGDYGWQAQGQTTGGLYPTRRERQIIRRAVGKLGVATVTLEGYLPLPDDYGDYDDLLGSL